MKKSERRNVPKIEEPTRPTRMSSQEAAETAIILSKEEGVTWEDGSVSPACESPDHSAEGPDVPAATKYRK